MKGIPRDVRFYEMQPHAILTQAAPVQNTYYALLNAAKNARVYEVVIRVATTDEDLALKSTIDGIASADPTAFAPGISIDCYPGWGSKPTAWRCKLSSSIHHEDYAFFCEGKSVTLEIRKTTANGTGTITAMANYSRFI